MASKQCANTKVSGIKMMSFFDKQYKTPGWLAEKLSRRHLLKSAAGATAVLSLNKFSFAATEQSFSATLTTDPWLTLNDVLMHLFPESETGPSAKDIRASHYLYNIVYQQPTAKDEVEFIFQGVGWLNGYSQTQKKLNFSQLSVADKETMLRAVSGSIAGENWISMLIGYLFEAMLAPPAYGGNPNGVGWQWLQHQAGFPLPQDGQRYYELPQRSSVAPAKTNTNPTLTDNTLASKNTLATITTRTLKA
jgi:hypothetical protein